MKNSKVSIIMYHFVRNLKQSPYPKLKALELSLFVEQLGYLQKYYTFITMEHLLASIHGNEELPEKAVLLTFDDGYSDHFEHVLPELVKRKIQGSFFIPAKAVMEKTVLDVNKIHFVLAAAELDFLIRRLFDEIIRFQADYNLQSPEFYYEKLATPNWLDTAEVMFVKRLLQKELPENLRNEITSRLFEELVGMSESDFSRQLYMSRDQLKGLISHGMHIGHHGYKHYWLNSLTEEEQTLEIQKGCEFLKELGVRMENWTMCYPYGAYDQSVLNLLTKHECKLALTTVVDIADLSKCNKFELPRLDTNDIPKERAAVVNEWYTKS